jgi:hypothetical protein
MAVSGKTILLITLNWVLTILHGVLVKENDCIGGREIARAPSCALTQLFLSFKRIQKKSVVLRQQLPCPIALGRKTLQTHSVAVASKIHPLCTKNYRSIFGQHWTHRQQSAPTGFEATGKDRPRFDPFVAPHQIFDSACHYVADSVSY